MKSNKKSKVLVSSCLAGVNCRYDGGSYPCAKVEQLVEEGRAVLVCPEQLGGFQTPRPSAEVQSDGKVKEVNGKDVSDLYEKGAQEALKVGRMFGCKKAILKNKSPMCGVEKVYDGSFSGKVIPGKGVFTKLLEENDFEVEGA